MLPERWHTGDTAEGQWDTLPHPSEVMTVKCFLDQSVVQKSHGMTFLHILGMCIDGAQLFLG